MTRLKYVLSGLLFAAATLAAGSASALDCGMNTGQKATGQPIPIGAVTSMSGIASFEEADLGAKAYFDCVNDSGGIHGRPIVYMDEDDQSRVDIAAQAAKKLVEDEGVYLMVGSTGFVDCVANSQYYQDHNILVIGLGIPPQCFESKNLAMINAGPRQSAIGAVDYARRALGIESMVCVIYKQPGDYYVCGNSDAPGGVYNWGQAFGVDVQSIYPDPSSPDFQSIALQVIATGYDAVQLLFVDVQGAQILEAAQQQDGAAVMKWTAPTSWYTARFPDAIDAKYWNDRVWINVELGPLDSQKPDNKNFLDVMAKYGPDVLMDSFTQAGYIAARIAVRAMLTIDGADKVSRDTVTSAIQNMPPYETDILCGPWYWGGPEATRHQPNHVTETVTIRDGKFEYVEGCFPVLDPDLGPIVEIENKLGINKEFNALWAAEMAKGKK
jgi:branched-chain amino acid transport system substrate-binding protein